jgi:hypothetical protein
MPYSKSKGREEFERLSNELLSLARQISFKKVLLSYEHKNLIYQSCIVLLSSSFEQYLKELIEDLFFNYRAKGASLLELPNNTRTFSLFRRHRTVFESFINNRDEAAVLEKLNVTNSYYSIINGSVPFTNHIDPKDIVNDKKYPSPKNLKILFNRIGVKNIFNLINRAGGKDYELILRSFLDIRETIAHQESTDLTFEDVRRNFTNIVDLIDKLDRATFMQVCKTSGMKFWK